MARELIKSQNGSTRGYLDEQGSRIYIRSESGNSLGFYDKNTKQTYSSSGSCIGKGNQLMILLNSD